jgi:hypothetical protein
MTKLNDEQRRALKVLARHPDGCTEAVLLADGSRVIWRDAGRPRSVEEKIIGRRRGSTRGRTPRRHEPGWAAVSASNEPPVMNKFNVGQWITRARIIAGLSGFLTFSQSSCQPRPADDGRRYADRLPDLSRTRGRRRRAKAFRRAKAALIVGDQSMSPSQPASPKSVAKIFFARLYFGVAKTAP